MANIRHNLIIAAPIEQVYEAITTERGLTGWWTAEVNAKPILGHINHFKFGLEFFNKMKIIDLTLPSQVLWECVEGDKEWVGTKISFELSEREGATFLQFSHKSWAEESEFFGFCSHHWGRYLDSLKALCETGKGDPYAAS